MYLGRLFWDDDHPSPWMEFRTITEFRTWRRDIRKARPGTKTEVTSFGHWTAESMLAYVRRDRG